MKGLMKTNLAKFAQARPKETIEGLSNTYFIEGAKKLGFSQLCFGKIMLSKVCNFFSMIQNTDSLQRH